MDDVTNTLAILRPDELDAAWRWISLMDRHGPLTADDATRWRLGIIALLQFWELDGESLPVESHPDDGLAPPP